MQQPFIYPGAFEAPYPSGAVFHTTDIEDLNTPYREPRIADGGVYPTRAMSDLYSAQPQARGAVPWWTNVGLGSLPVDGVYTHGGPDLLRGENIQQKIKRYYYADGLLKPAESPTPRTSDGKVVEKSTESRLWRKVCDPKRADLHQVDGRLVWKNKASETDKPRTVVVDNRQPVPVARPQLVTGYPYRSYT